MFRKRFAIRVCAIAFCAFAASGASAFEQTPLPQASSPAVPPQVTAPALSPGLALDEQAKDAQPDEKKQRGFKIPGLGTVTLPKLNFGLDLMYGSPESDDTELGFTNDANPGDDDLRIMGKVKRRF